MLTHPGERTALLNLSTCCCAYQLFCDVSQWNRLSTNDTMKCLKPNRVCLDIIHHRVDNETCIAIVCLIIHMVPHALDSDI